MKTLAILTDSIRFDNHHPLKYCKRLKVVHFYHSAPYGDLEEEDLKDAIRWKDLKDLEEKLLKIKPDIIQGAEIYASKTQLKLCYIAWKISRKLKIPLIFPTLENRPVNDRFGPVAGHVLKRILKAYAKRAKLIFYLNNGALRNLLEVGANPKKLIKMLYGVWGVDTSIFRPLKPKTLNQKPYILFVGRLDEAKGIPYLLDAWNSVKKEFPNIEMIFIGKGELEDKVKGKQIKHLDWMKTQDIPPYFANALFTVYPSVTLRKWAEQVGTVNLQSLACGTPVITTESGAIPEYITSEVGVLVPERDSKALASAMKKLLKNPELRQKLGENGRKLVLEKYDAAKNIQKIEKILLGLL